MSLRFRQLQALHATIDTGTVTGAADLLGISQPGISNLLAQLERQTKLKLFNKVKGRLVPTSEADVLYREVDTVVRGLDHVTQAVTDLQNRKAGQLQIASTHSVSFGYMPREISRFAKNRPDMTISYQSQYSSKIQEWVRSGLFEIGVCELPIFSDGLHQTLFRFEMSCAFPADSPLAEKDVLTPQDLDGYPFIVMGPEHMTHRRTREAFQSAGCHWNIRCHTHMFRNKLSFVKEGMGAALVDPFTHRFDVDSSYVTRPFRPQITNDVAIITLNNRPLSALGQEFLAQITETLAPYATHSETGAAAS